MTDAALPPDAPDTPVAAPPPAQPGGALRRWARRLLWLVVVVLLLSAAAWQGVPALLRWQGTKIASEQLGRAVQIGAVHFNPWTLELTVQDLSVAGLTGAPPQASIKRVYVNAAWASLVRLAPVVDAIQIEAPALRLTHKGDGHYDVDDIIARLTAPPGKPDSDKPAHFALYNIDITGGRVDFDDQAVGRTQHLSDLHLALPFISNLPSAREVTVQPQLAFDLNGSRFDSSAQALPFDDSHRTAAALHLAGFDLKPYLGYLPVDLPLKLQAAVVDADLRLHFEQTPRQSLRLEGTLTVNGLKANDAQGAEALAFDALKLQLADVRPLEQRVHLASVELDRPQLALHRDKDGRLNLLPPIATKKEAAGAGASSATAASRAPSAGASRPASAASGAAAASAPPAFELRVDQLAVHEGTVNLRDDSTASDQAGAVSLRLTPLELSASQIAWPLVQPLSFKGSTTLAGIEALASPPVRAETSAPAPASRRTRGRQRAPAVAAKPATPVAKVHGAAPTLAFEGSATARQADVKAQVAGVPLALAAPYLAPYLAPRLDGVLDSQVQLHWSDAPGPQPDLKVTADQLTLSQLALRGGETPAAPRASARERREEREARATPLPSIERVSVTNAQLDLRAHSVQVGELALQQPRVSVERTREGHWMYESWLRQPASAPQPPHEPAAHAKVASDERPWALRLQALTLKDGTVGWVDRSVARTRPVRAELTQLQVSAHRFELGGKQAFPVELSARLGTGRRSGGEPGRLSWRGEIGQVPLSAQGEVDAERLPLQAFEPYLDDVLNVDILRADTSYKGRVAFTQTDKGPRLRAQGDARVEELRTYSRAGTATSTAESGTAAAPRAAASAPAAASQAPLAPVAGAATGNLGEELASWKQLRLSALDVQLEPGAAPQVVVGATRLSDFFVRLVIHSNGRFNLQDVVKTAAGEAAAARPAAAAAAAPTTGQPAAGEFNAGASNSIASSASGASAEGHKPSKPDALAPVLRFGPTELVNGRVDFADHFIRPNYSADLSELNGTLGPFSSVAPSGAPQMAALQLTGRAEGTAQLDVSGQLNPLADPLALDIHAQVKELDLPPLSPYSVKYAGHGIERGKLSMDVNYKIQPDGQLTATNKLVLNQLQFGEPVAGAPASLPVQLATALLADSNGVIDLDLPISGSLNDPQFSLGPIIFKAIVNLIGKAITAPFSLLARALSGGGEGDLSQVAFAPGSASLSSQARAQLDKVAKALKDRPQLKLTVAGSAELAAEREGYRRQRLRALVAAEARGDEPAVAAAEAASAPASAAAGVASAPASAAAAVPDTQYPELLRRLYRRADIPGRPRNAIGMLRDVPQGEMESLLMAQIPVSADAMRQLAVQRGVAVKDYLASQGVPAARLFLGAVQMGAAAGPGAEASAPASAASGSGSAAKPWSPHAELSLGTR